MKSKIIITTTEPPPTTNRVCAGSSAYGRAHVIDYFIKMLKPVKHSQLSQNNTAIEKKCSDIEYQFFKNIGHLFRDKQIYVLVNAMHSGHSGPTLAFEHIVLGYRLG